MGKYLLDSRGAPSIQRDGLWFACGPGEGILERDLEKDHRKGVLKKGAWKGILELWCWKRNPGKESWERVHGKGIMEKEF